MVKKARRTLYLADSLIKSRLYQTTISNIWLENNSEYKISNMSEAQQSTVISNPAQVAPKGQLYAAKPSGLYNTDQAFVDFGQGIRDAESNRVSVEAGQSHFYQTIGYLHNLDYARMDPAAKRSNELVVFVRASQANNYLLGLKVGSYFRSLRQSGVSEKEIGNIATALGRRLANEGKIWYIADNNKIARTVTNQVVTRDVALAAIPKTDPRITDFGIDYGGDQIILGANTFYKDFDNPSYTPGQIMSVLALVNGHRIGQEADGNISVAQTNVDALDKVLGFVLATVNPYASLAATGFSGAIRQTAAYGVGTWMGLNENKWFNSLDHGQKADFITALTAYQYNNGYLTEPKGLNNPLEVRSSNTASNYYRTDLKPKSARAREYLRLMNSQKPDGVAFRFNKLDPKLIFGFLDPSFGFWRDKGLPTSGSTAQKAGFKNSNNRKLPRQNF